jgi:hypothetical protein
MGMFDHIQLEKACIGCTEMLDEWQSKNGDCELQILTLPELLEQSKGYNAYIYTSCDNCGMWNQYLVVPPKDITLVEAPQNYW